MKPYVLLMLGLVFIASGANVASLAQSNAPTNLQATSIVHNQVDLKWNDNSANEIKFEIERVGITGSFVKIGEASSNTPTYQDKTVTSLNTYNYRVRAVFVTNSSVYSNTLTVNSPQEPPGTPTGLTATLQGGSVLVKWDNGSGGTATSYRVERSVQGGAYSLYQTVAYSRTPSLSDNGVQPGQQYCYRVQATNGGGSSGFVGPVCQSIPLAPTNLKNLKATAVSSSAIKLNWDPYGKESPITIQRSIGQNGAWTNLANTLADGGEYTDNTAQPGTEYCYRIAEDGHEVSARVCDTTPAVVPITPTGLTILSISTDQLQVFWTDANVVPVTFEISRSDKLGGNYTIIQPNYGSKIYDDKNLPASTQYCYRVRARNGSTYSNYSTEVCGNTKTPVPTAPSPPGNLTITNISSDRIDLQWTDQSDNETNFQIERADSPTAVFQKIQELGVNATNFSDQTVQSNKQYCYRVQAINGVGPSGYTETKCATTPAPPPGVPTNLRVTIKSTTEIDVTFSASNASAGDFYEVQRATAAGSYQVVKNVQIDASGNGLLNDTGLQPNTRYCYKIRRYSAPQTDFSGEVCANTPDVPPTTPTNLTITAVTYNQISLQWADQSTNESNFVLERSTNGTSFDKLADLPTNTSNYNDQTVAPQTRYYYRVRAVNAAGPSGNSNLVDATTPVGPPTAAQDLKAVATSTTQISLTWGTISNAATIVIERSPDGVSNWNSITTVAGNTTSYTDNGLTPNQHYYYRIRATNVSGTGNNSNIADAITPDVPPKEPARLTATVISSTQINLAWADLSTNESGFEVEQGNSQTGTFTNIAKLPANTNTFEVKGLTDATQYCYRVRAVNAAGPSAYTDPVCATTPLAPPVTPTNLTAMIFDYDQIRLTWDALSLKAVTVSIQRSTSPTGPFQEIKQLPAANLTSYVDVGLQEYTTYYYQIRAINTAGNSNFSNIAQARVEEVVIAVEDEWITQTQAFVENHTLHIRTDWHRSTPTHIQLHSLSGQVKFSDNRRVMPTDAWSYSLGQTPAGLYVVALVADGRVFTQKILVP